MQIRDTAANVSFVAEDGTVTLWGSPTDSGSSTTEVKAARQGAKIIAEKTAANKWFISGEKST
jgi:hypothetical protein